MPRLFLAFTIILYAMSAVAQGNALLSAVADKPYEIPVLPALAVANDQYNISRPEVDKGVSQPKFVDHGVISKPTLPIELTKVVSAAVNVEVKAIKPEAGNVNDVSIKLAANDKAGTSQGAADNVANSLLNKKFKLPAIELPSITDEESEDDIDLVMDDQSNSGMSRSSDKQLSIPEVSFPKTQAAGNSDKQAFIVPVIEEPKSDAPKVTKIVKQPKSPKPAMPVLTKKADTKSELAKKAQASDKKTITAGTVEQSTTQKPNNNLAKAAESQAKNPPKTTPQSIVPSSTPSVANNTTPKTQAKPIKVVVTPGVNANDLAGELNRVIEKSTTESRLSKYDMMILEDIFSEVNSEDADNVDNIVQRIKPGHTDYVDNNDDNSVQPLSGIDLKIKALDDKIAATQKGSATRQKLLKQRKSLVTEKRFYLDYNVGASKILREVNNKSNKHIPNDYSNRELLPYVYQAIAENNIFKIGQLLEMMGYQDLVDDHGNNLVMKAAMYDNLRVLFYFVQQHGFSVHKANNYNATPLHVAANNGNYDMVKYLLGLSASAYIEDNAGRT
ncbi:MAG: ankyrin repeat domain-containing protein, partial [Pseudomonadota bacterium]